MTVADLPESVRRVILERSEGNPFYLEEIIRSEHPWIRQYFHGERARHTLGPPTGSEDLHG